MIQALIDKVIDNAMRYPSNWDNQDINAIKVDLPSDSQEYQQIEAEFQKTEQGKISKIFRLQNLRLWEYYQSEVQKLQDLSIQRNTPLTQIELDRYLWHGIKGQHPKLIYESSMEGFDTICSNEGMKGFYFSQQANYYRSSTYCLTDQDDPLYAGQLVGVPTRDYILNPNIERVYFCLKVFNGYFKQLKKQFVIILTMEQLIESSIQPLKEESTITLIHLKPQKPIPITQNKIAHEEQFSSKNTQASDTSLNKIEEVLHSQIQPIPQIYQQDRIRIVQNMKSKIQIIQRPTVHKINDSTMVLQYELNTKLFTRLAKSNFIEFRKSLNQIQQMQINLQIKITSFNIEKNEIEFNIKNENNTSDDQIRSLLKKEFVQKLQIYEVQIDFNKFLEYLKVDINGFETNYDIIVGKIQDKITFLSTKYFLDQVILLIQQFQLSTQPQILLLKQDSNLIFQKLQQMIQSNELNISKEVKYLFKGTSIQLAGPNTYVTASQQLIIKKEQELKSQLIKRTLDLNHKEASYFHKKIQPKKQEQYINEFECEIKEVEDKLWAQESMASSLSYEGKELNVMYADISRFECEAIVNSCNNLMSFGKVDMSSGVAKNIFDKAGPSYTQFCESYIKENKTLEYGKAITYHIPGQSNVVQKYIINVSTPIYQNGEQTNQDILNIEQNIKAIFVEANKLNIKTLALPIFGGGASGYSFKLIAQNVLNYLINVLYSEDNKTVQKVFVTELSKDKINQISLILNKITEKPEGETRQVKYQWQWYNNFTFQDYDDEDINRQIDEGYEQFQNQKQNLEIQLAFPFTKQPGTHLVDLKQMIITDIALSTKINLSLSQNKGNEIFLFNNQEIEDVMNEYLMIQKLNNNFKFEIFYKKHKIVFNTNGSIQQINEATGYSRNVKYVPIQKNKQQKSYQNILVGKTVKHEKKEIDWSRVQQQITKIWIESFNIEVINNLQKTIKQDIGQYTTNFTIQLPLIKQEDFNELKTSIIESSIYSNSQIENGKKITIQIFKEKQEKIQKEIDKMIAKTTKYPNNWIQQDKNHMKVDLNSDSQEYKEIEVEFQKTDQGKIFKIYRLQNQTLWEKYQSEKENLLNINLQRNTSLTQLEQERYLWHGVKRQHPKIIYESMNEAFDITYSDNGMWGLGIYFAEKASYSRDYSYKLTQQDDPIHAGKRVFLCCKVATGRIHTCDPDSTIKRPPAGYDCVSGFTNGSNVFILYGMDVRRAYPAYEIIYE